TDVSGTYIYMVWNKGEEGLNPIIEIDFVVGDSNQIDEKKGASWATVNHDLKG
ncbi:20944_t:CDS:1, partial [Racocetra persica]